MPACRELGGCFCRDASADTPPAAAVEDQFTPVVSFATRDAVLYVFGSWLQSGQATDAMVAVNGLQRLGSARPERMWAA